MVSTQPMDEFLVDEELEEHTAGWVGLSTKEEIVEYELKRRRVSLVTTLDKGAGLGMVTHEVEETQCVEEQSSPCTRSRAGWLGRREQ